MEKKSKNTKKKLEVFGEPKKRDNSIILVYILGIVVVMSVIVGISKLKPNSTPNSISTVSSNPTPSEVSLTLSSPTKQYELRFTTVLPSNTTTYSLHRQNKEIVREIIDSSVNPNTSNSSAGWLSDSVYFLNDSTQKVVSVIDASNPIKSYQLKYGHTTFQLVGINNQASLFLWKDLKNSKDQLDTAMFILTDDQLVEYESYELSNIPGGQGTYFDPVNNGVLFVKRFEELDCTSYWHTVDFYDFKDQSTKTISYTTKQTQPTCKSSCNEIKVISMQKGTVSLSTTCLNQDNPINISLSINNPS